MLLEWPLVKLKLLLGNFCVLLGYVLLVLATVLVKFLDLLIEQALPHLCTLLHSSDALSHKLLQLGREIRVLCIGKEDCVLQRADVRHEQLINIARGHLVFILRVRYLDLLQGYLLLRSADSLQAALVELKDGVACFQLG